MDLTAQRNRPTCINCGQAECCHKGTMAWWNELTPDFAAFLFHVIDQQMPRRKKAFKQMYSFLYDDKGQPKPFTGDSLTAKNIADIQESLTRIPDGAEFTITAPSCNQFKRIINAKEFLRFCIENSATNTGVHVKHHNPRIDKGLMIAYDHRLVDLARRIAGRAGTVVDWRWTPTYNEFR